MKQATDEQITSAANLRSPDVNDILAELQCWREMEARRQAGRLRLHVDMKNIGREVAPSLAGDDRRKVLTLLRRQRYLRGRANMLAESKDKEFSLCEAAALCWVLERADVVATKGSETDA